MGQENWKTLSQSWFYFPTTLMSSSHEHSAASVPGVTYAHGQKLNREHPHSALKLSIRHCKLSASSKQPQPGKKPTINALALKAPCLKV